MFDELLVGIDGGSGGRDALRLAEQLAGPEADLTLGHVYHGDQEQRAMAMLDAERLRGYPDGDTVCIDDPSTGQGLQRLAQRTGADVLVVGSSRYGAIGPALLDDQRHPDPDTKPYAVAIASHGYARDARTIRTIGVMFDGSPGSWHVLNFAWAMAQRIGAAVHAITVIDLQAVSRLAPLARDWPTASRQLVADAQRQLDELDGVAGLACYGSSREELTKLAGRVDLVILGAHHSGSTTHPFDDTGSALYRTTAIYLDRHATCGLLILPDGDHEPVTHNVAAASLAASDGK